MRRRPPVSAMPDRALWTRPEPRAISPSGGKSPCRPQGPPRRRHLRRAAHHPGDDWAPWQSAVTGAEGSVRPGRRNPTLQSVPCRRWLRGTSENEPDGPTRQPVTGSQRIHPTRASLDHRSAALAVESPLPLPPPPAVRCRSSRRRASAQPNRPLGQRRPERRPSSFSGDLKTGAGALRNKRRAKRAMPTGKPAQGTADAQLRTDRSQLGEPPIIRPDRPRPPAGPTKKRGERGLRSDSVPCAQAAFGPAATKTFVAKPAACRG